jgi:hypothetical protein
MVIIEGGHPFAHFAKGWEFSEGSMQLLRVHVGAQDGVDCESGSRAAAETSGAGRHVPSTLTEKSHSRILGFMREQPTPS